MNIWVLRVSVVELMMNW